MADLLDCPFCDGAHKCEKSCISRTVPNPEFAALYLGWVSARENTSFTVPACLSFYYTQGRESYFESFPERNKISA